MILTHLAFARNTIPVFYILKCLQIIRRFYVKKKQNPNFRPVVSEIVSKNPLRISLVNVNNPQKMADFFLFTKEILNRKHHFLCIDSVEQA